MSDVHTQITQAEEHIEELKKQAELGEALLRLQNNADFRKAINEEFLVKEAARFVQLSEDPALRPEERQDSLRIAQASGHLKRWMSIQIRMANSALDGIKQAEEFIEELRAVGASE